MSWLVYMFCSIYLKRKTMRKVLSIIPFYRWGNWGKELLMKLLVSERDAFWWGYWSTFSKHFRKGHYLSRLLGEKTHFQFSVLKKKSCYLDLRNVLGVLYVLLHLIKQKSMRNCQHSHFIDEETEARGINEVSSKWRRCIFVSLFIYT